MADRTIKVTLRANVADFTANMRAAGTATERLAKDLGGAEKVSTTTLGRMAQSMKVHRDSWERTGTAMMTGRDVLAGTG